MQRLNISLPPWAKLKPFLVASAILLLTAVAYALRWWTTAHLALMGLAFIQSVAFSLVSRSRNRSNITYHIFASIASNGVWFLTFRSLVTQHMDFSLFIPYTVGTVCGSVFGVKVSMWIEKLLGAESDSHLAPKKPASA